MATGNYSRLKVVQIPNVIFWPSLALPPLNVSLSSLWVSLHTKCLSWLLTFIALLFLYEQLQQLYVLLLFSLNSYIWREETSFFLHWRTGRKPCVNKTNICASAEVCFCNRLLHEHTDRLLTQAANKWLRKPPLPREVGIWLDSWLSWARQRCDTGVLLQGLLQCGFFYGRTREE